jgi:hypothetical protein
MGWNIIGMAEGKKPSNYGLAHIEKASERPILVSVNGAPKREKENDDDAACERILRSGHVDVDLCSL